MEQGLERKLQERVEAMQREKLQDPAVRLNPDPVSSAEPVDVSPSDFRKRE